MRVLQQELDERIARQRLEYAPLFLGEKDVYGAERHFFRLLVVLRECVAKQFAGVLLDGPGEHFGFKTHRQAVFALVLPAFPVLPGKAEDFPQYAGIGISAFRMQVDAVVAVVAGVVERFVCPQRGGIAE